MSCYLYACAFSDGTVKVGRTIAPRRRLNEHRKAAACFGILVQRTHTAVCAGDACAAEAELLEKCLASTTDRRQDEWFGGLTFEDVCDWLNDSARREHADTVAALVRRAGGPLTVAKALGISRDTVRKWDRLPAHHAPTVHRMAGPAMSPADVYGSMFARLIRRATAGK